MTYSIDIVHSVTQIPPADWDQLGGGQLYSSHRWYAFSETVLSGDKPVYLIVKSDGVAIARAAFWIKYGDVLPVSNWVLARLVNAYLSHRPMMICHTPLTSLHGLVLPEGEERETVFNLIMDAASKIARQEKVSFLVLDYLPQSLAEQLTHNGALFPLTLSEPGTILSLSEDSFEAYLKTLSNNERRNIRRAKNKVRKMGVEIREEETVPDIESALALISNHDEKYHSDTYSWLRQAMNNLDQVDSIWLGAYHGDKLVGCGLLLGDDGTWFATALGRNYDYPFVYFDLCYESIAHVIEHGGRSIRLGTGNYAFKERLRFTLEDNAAVSFKARNRVLDWLLRKVAKWMV